MLQSGKILLLILFVLSILGCSSTGPVPIGKDTYMSSNGSGPYTTGASLLADLYVEGNKFCDSKGMEFQPLSEQGVDGAPFIRNSKANIKFRCLKKGDSELSRPTMKPAANVRIESEIREKKEIQTQQSGDMYTELRKLKELLDSGVITQSEFETQKAKILNK